jgi:hypothetical protein
VRSAYPCALRHIRDDLLSGIRIERGELLVDGVRLLYPAICCTKPDVWRLFSRTAPALRARRTTARLLRKGRDCAVLCPELNIGLDPAIVFHGDGYRGAAQAIMENFAAGRYVGVPILEWVGLTASSARNGALGVRAYPHMLKWLAG